MSHRWIPRSNCAAFGGKGEKGKHRKTWKMKQKKQKNRKSGKVTVLLPRSEGLEKVKSRGT